MNMWLQQNSVLVSQNPFYTCEALLLKAHICDFLLCLSLLERNSKWCSTQSVHHVTGCWRRILWLIMMVQFHMYLDLFFFCFLWLRSRSLLKSRRISGRLYEIRVHPIQSLHCAPSQSTGKVPAEVFFYFLFFLKWIKDNRINLKLTKNININ